MYTKKTTSDIKNTLKLLAILLALSFIVTTLTEVLGANDLDKVSQNIENTKQAFGAGLWLLLGTRVIAEEIFFRGFLTKKTGALFSSVVFGLAHAGYGSATEIIGATILGFVLAKAFQKNKNLLPNIAAHFTYNAIFLVFFL